MEEKILCGSARIIKTQYGDLTKLSFSKTDLEKMLNNLNENGWINCVVKEKKFKNEGSPTHYIEVDTWKPKQTTENKPELSEDDSLPF